MLFEILSELIQINDILFIVKNDGATSEIRSDSLSIRQKDKWINLGDNDGPAHMHINSELIKSAKFVEEERPERTSFSVRFFDNDENRILAAFFTKMYGPSKSLIIERKKLFDTLKTRYSIEIQF
ncbi:ChuX/HutX family heme-like substrate-binding protein [Nitrosopumilus sp.]|uniref:ChuX/HutX family heme-like substrate-binding protein n=1 Tax=Nitrosopumilus sp. TaxID=2024843 RepID=UPI00292F56E1|nr:ChuX/HutX family heme-like substrate-binding protein [Nitrosopumilus sp.]